MKVQRIRGLLVICMIIMRFQGWYSLDWASFARIHLKHSVSQCAFQQKCIFTCTCPLAHVIGFALAHVIGFTLTLVIFWFTLVKVIGFNSHKLVIGFTLGQVIWFIIFAQVCNYTLRLAQNTVGLYTSGAIYLFFMGLGDEMRICQWCFTANLTNMRDCCFQE